MKVKKLKLIGAVSASIALLTSSVTSMTAFADVSPVPGSSFAYDFTASVVTEPIIARGTQIYPGDVAVTFQVTNNPGTDSFAFALFYEDGYEIKSCSRLNEFGELFTESFFPNKIDNRFFYTACVGNNAITLETETVYDNFFITIYFRPTENIKDSNSKFSIALTHYNSPSMSDSFDIKLDRVTPDTDIDGPSSYDYVKGDLDNDGYITLDDASKTNELGARAMANLNSRSVEIINKNLFTEQWRKWFPKLIYAEVADTDENGLINSDDTQKIVDYYANEGAGTPLESIVGKKATKTIYIKKL